MNSSQEVSIISLTEQLGTISAEVVWKNRKHIPDSVEDFCA